MSTEPVIVIEEPMRRCGGCRELIAQDPDGKTWRHPHSGDVECWTGDGQVAFPEPLDGPEKWVPEAIAEQEAYLAKRRAEKEAEREQRRVEADQ